MENKKNKNVKTKKSRVVKKIKKFFRGAAQLLDISPGGTPTCPL